MQIGDILKCCQFVSHAFNSQLFLNLDYNKCENKQDNNNDKHVNFKHTFNPNIQKLLQQNGK